MSVRSISKNSPFCKSDIVFLVKLC